MPRHNKPNVLSVLKHEVTEFLKTHPDGVTKSTLHKKFVGGPIDLEENRKSVWMLNAALVGLQYERMVAVASHRSTDYYYPRSTV